MPCTRTEIGHSEEKRKGTYTHTQYEGPAFVSGRGSGLFVLLESCWPRLTCFRAASKSVWDHAYKITFTHHLASVVAESRNAPSNGGKSDFRMNLI